MRNRQTDRSYYTYVFYTEIFDCFLHTRNMMSSIGASDGRIVAHIPVYESIYSIPCSFFYAPFIALLAQITFSFSTHAANNIYMYIDVCRSMCYIYAFIHLYIVHIFLSMNVTPNKNDLRLRLYKCKYIGRQYFNIYMHICVVIYV